MATILGLTKSKSPHASNSTALTTRSSGGSKSGGGGRRKNTILMRNRSAAVEAETLLWRALCDDPISAMEYIDKDAVMVSPLLFFGDVEPRAKDSEPSLEEALGDCEQFMTFKMHESQVVEIDMMAVAILYTVTLFRYTDQKEEGGNQTFQPVEATVSSSWKQTAGGDWRLACMHAAYL